MNHPRLFKNGITVFVLGALIGPIGDWCHMTSGTLSYNATAPQLRIFFGLPFWVPPLFGLAALSIATCHLLFNNKAIRPSHLKVSQGTLAFLLLYAASGFLPLETGGARDVVLALGALGIWAWLERTWQGMAVGVAVGVIGSLFEIFLVHHGVFSYGSGMDNMFGVPSWLPWVYFGASIAIENLQLRIK